MHEDRLTLAELNGDYLPTAIYYDDSDSLEYIRRDASCVYRRIDPFLTLIFSMNDRALLGFRLKGFRHFYLHRRRNRNQSELVEFPLLVGILEEAMSDFGGKIFDEQERLSAYTEARNIAEEDRVVLRDFTKVA
jgi:hypothetical protein